MVRASAASRAAALTASRIEEIVPPPDGAVTWLAGGKQTKGALPARSGRFDAAVYSSRGRGYARYNEDAAALFGDSAGRIYAAVLDQAGGLGGRVRGAASEMAAMRLFEAWQEIAKSKTPADETKLMIEAMQKAHAQLVDRREGEVTTAVALVAKENDAILVNSGDSGALHFDAKGQLKAATLMHEHDSPLAVGCLTHAIGLIPETALPDSYRWTLEKGDWILLCTDGLLDAGLSNAEIGDLLLTSSDAEMAVNKLCTRVLRMMSTLRAKPDNLSVVAVRAS
jgi:serine/threonine protein phosphatase PrpC